MFPQLLFDFAPYGSWVDLTQARAEQLADQMAYCFLKEGQTTNQTITYKVLAQRAQAGAIYLQNHTKHGDRVLLMFPAGIDFIVALLSCFYANVIAVPVAIPRNQRSLYQFQNIFADTEPEAILTEHATLQAVQSFLPQLSPQLNWILIEQFQTASGADWDSAGTLQPIAALQYTSGSTGNPKGVMLSHANLLYNVGQIAAARKPQPEDHLVCWLPAFHDWGLIGFLLHALYSGTPCTFMDPLAFLQNPFRWLQTISQTRATFSGAPNFAYDLCSRMITPQQRETLDLSTWKAALVGAEPIHAETLEKFASLFEQTGFRREAYVPCYGLAESTLWVSGTVEPLAPFYLQVSAAALQQQQVRAAETNEIAQVLVGCGPVVGDHEIFIVDPTQQVSCPPDVIGEVWVRGSSVAQGYWQQDEETTKTFQAYLASTGEGPFLRTGDLGFLHQGELFITGRLKEIIIIAGRNYYPQDIERSVESSHPDLRVGHGAAFAITHNRQDCLVVLHEAALGRRPDWKQVIGLIQKNIVQTHGLSAYAILILKPGTIPKTSSGKIMRRACSELFLEQKLQSLASWQHTVLT